MTQLLLYNYNDIDITVDFSILVDDEEVKTPIGIGAKTSVLSPPILKGSGALVKGKRGKKFLPLSLTGSQIQSGLEGEGATESTTLGTAYDWGFSLIPTSKLAKQVLVGWGYGCVENSCTDTDSAATVFVTPTSDADIYVDYENSGIESDFAVVEARKLGESLYPSCLFDQWYVFLTLACRICCNWR